MLMITSEMKQSARAIRNFLVKAGRDGLTRKMLMESYNHLLKYGWKKEHLPDLRRAIMLIGEERDVAMNYIFKTSVQGHPIERKIKGGNGGGVIKDIGKLLKDL